KLLDALDVQLRRRAAGPRPGDQRAAGVGSGTELAQLRPYEIGDDVRQLDPAATARTGTPHVRLHVPERAMTTWLVLDVSPSMAFGTAERLKSDVAEGVALALGRLALRRAGRLGAVTFGAPGPGLLPPRGGRPAFVALSRAVGAGVAPDGPGDRSGLAGALDRLTPMARRRGLLAVVSDFRDQEGWIRPLRRLGQLHDVLAIEIGDPREARLPAVGHLTLVDPETGRHLAVDTSRPGVCRRYAQAEAARREALARDLRAARARHVALSTDGPWLRTLAGALR
ncbi:MAG TPA: DUF58 domain-containing protein, partial [Solirubrobacteraceae bacterium]|nr:DUF58 domain-containing protein [Solirubrobacteraceae bacterium]